jgi:hypothetical protein
MTENVVRETVGVFHDEASLQNAVDEMLISGFDRSSLSLLASQHAVEEKLGHKYEKVGELEDDLSIPRTVYIGKDSRTEAETAVVSGLAYVGALGAAGAIVASGGTIAAAILGAAAAAGVGGAIGGVLARFMDRHHAKYLQEQLDHGGLLLWVATHGTDQENKAHAILQRCGAGHVHAHTLPAPASAMTGGVSYDISFMKRLGL